MKTFYRFLLIVCVFVLLAACANAPAPTDVFISPSPLLTSSPISEATPSFTPPLRTPLPPPPRPLRRLFLSAQ